MRTFLALDLDPNVTRTLSDLIDAARRSLPPARWVRPQGLHVTLKFFGLTRWSVAWFSIPVS
jgi:2'-5' RNA ligase